MPLTLIQKEFITEIDFQTHQILQQSGQEALLMFLAKKLPELKAIMDAATHDELDWYCEKFDGFRQAMRLLEQLAKGCAEGLFDDIL